MDFKETYNKNKEKHLLKETTAAGEAASFVGRSGMTVDSLFGGPFFPSEYDLLLLLKQQLKDRKLRRNWMEKESGDNYTGEQHPVGGYYDASTESLELAYDELTRYKEKHQEYSLENTPLSYTKFIEIGWDYIYDKIDTYGNDIDIMVEAKRKELAVQKYLEIHGES